MYFLKGATKAILVLTAIVTLAGCLESEDLLVDENYLADPFGNNFGMTYLAAEGLIPRGKWFETMTSNGKFVQVGFVAPKFLKASSKYSYWITIVRSPASYGYALMRINKQERSAYVCRYAAQTISTQQALYDIIAEDYRDMVKNGIGDNPWCGVPSYIRDVPSIAIRKPLPTGDLSLEEKEQFIEELIDMAKLGRKRDTNNVAYEYLSRGGILVECKGPFYGRIVHRADDQSSEGPFSLLMIYLGEPSQVDAQNEDFKACSIALRKMEYMLKENAMGSMGMPMIAGNQTPERLVAIDRNYGVIYDSERNTEETHIPANKPARD